MLLRCLLPNVDNAATMSPLWDTAPMHRALRISGGLLLIALAVGLVVMSCRWGAGLDRVAILVMPGGPPQSGLYAADWLATHPVRAQLLGVGLPIMLLTTAVWLLSRAGSAK